MLHEFLTENREELVNRCRQRVAQRTAPQPSAAELEYGIPLFLDQLILTLRAEVDGLSDSRADFTAAAEQHGNALLKRGFTVDQVIHDYGDLCQVAMQLASETKAAVSVDEFRTFNRCLDDAIANAVTEFGRQRDRTVSAQGTSAMSERLGALAHELRNFLNTAILAFDAIKAGNVGVTGATSAVLDRSLAGLHDVVDRSLAEVRLESGLDVHPEKIDLHSFVEELQVAAAMNAKAMAIPLMISIVEDDLTVYADRQMLGSAVSNLLQNAFKFSHANGQVTLGVRGDGDRVLIEVEDACGGLPKGKAEAMFQAFEQMGRDRSGIGLGLWISRRAVEANGGVLRVRDMPGAGCVFTIDLPRPSAE
jgi:signal transduction histidine kinase